MILLILTYFHSCISNDIGNEIIAPGLVKYFNLLLFKLNTGELENKNFEMFTNITFLGKFNKTQTLILC
jgi:hypothetical protein